MVTIMCLYEVEYASMEPLLHPNENLASSGHSYGSLLSLTTPLSSESVVIGVKLQATFWVELRELIRDEDQDIYDDRVFVVRESFPNLHVRNVQFQDDNCFDFEFSDLSQCLLQVDYRNSAISGYSQN